MFYYSVYALCFSYLLYEYLIYVHIIIYYLVICFILFYIMFFKRLGVISKTNFFICIYVYALFTCLYWFSIGFNLANFSLWSADFIPSIFMSLISTVFYLRGVLE